MDRTIAVVGAGTTGSHLLDLLTGTGADITVIDRDVVAERNLETAALYTMEMVEDGTPKAVAAEQMVAARHAGEVTGRVADVEARTVHDLLDGADVVVDCTDTVETRRLLNEWSLGTGTPWIHTAALGDQGTVLPVIPEETPCFDCVFGNVDGTALATCSSTGIDRATARTVARTAADLAREVLAGDIPAGLRQVTGEAVRTVDVKLRDGCAACRGETPHLDGERGTRATAVCGPDTYQVRPDHEMDLEPSEVAENNDFDGEVTVNDHLVRVEGVESFTLFRDGRMVVEADGPERARAIHARVAGG